MLFLFSTRQGYNVSLSFFFFQLLFPFLVLFIFILLILFECFCNTVNRFGSLSWPQSCMKAGLLNHYWWKVIGYFLFHADNHTECRNIYFLFPQFVTHSYATEPLLKIMQVEKVASYGHIIFKTKGCRLAFVISVMLFL